MIEDEIFACYLNFILFVKLIAFIYENLLLLSLSIRNCCIVSITFKNVIKFFGISNSLIEENFLFFFICNFFIVNFIL